MNENNIEQNKLLKEAVREALLKLMETKSYQSIFITELCEAAGVSRMGFYRNYTSKDDVIAEITHDLYTKACHDVGRYFSLDINEKKKWYADYFQYLLDNEKGIRIMYDAGFQGRSLNEITNMLLNQENLSDEERVRRIIFYGALFNLSLRWLLRENKESIQDMSKYCLKYLTK